MKGGFEIDHGVELQQHPEEVVGNADDGCPGAARLLQGADQVDVGDLLLAGDVEHLSGPRLGDAGGDDVAEVADIERLAEIAAVAGDREDRRARHETGQPAQMLAVEPAVHQRRPQHAGRDAAVEEQLLLRLLGLGVEIVRERVHDRRADMDDLGDAVPARGREDPLGRDHVVGGEGRFGEGRDLGMAEDEGAGAGQRLLPSIVRRQVGLDQPDIRVKPGEDLVVGGMLVDADQPDPCPAP